jgi:hypothetical protein
LWNSADEQLFTKINFIYCKRLRGLYTAQLHGSNGCLSTDHAIWR